jgi:hypothetical protein
MAMTTLSWVMFGGFGIASEGPRAREDHAIAAEPIVAN